MRVKQLWEVIPLPAKAKLFWERITFSRITTFYFVFSVFHCLIQIIFQVQAFSINARAANFLWQLVVQADAKDPGFAVLTDGELRFCEDVPPDLSVTSCELIWKAAGNNLTSTPTSVVPVESPFFTPAQSSAESLGVTSTPTSLSVSTSSTLVGSSTSVSPALVTSTSTVGSSKVDADSDSEDESDSDSDFDDNESDNDSDFGDDASDLEGPGGTVAVKREEAGVFRVTTVDVNGTAEIIIDGFGFDNKTVQLSRRCLYTLNWPVEKLDNTKREDITFIGFQIWVLGMSIVAILNESIPHIIASLLTHILATGWGGFQIAQTDEFRKEFNRMTTDGACGINLLSSYWQSRANAEIPSLALNALSLLLSLFLSWRLFKLFGWQTFKRVGASRTINRIYKLVLTLSITIQLALFFIVASIGLWLDSLINGVVGRHAEQASLYKVLMIVVLVLLVPWLSIGWIAVRRELRLPMLIFLVLSAGYLTGWAAMFASATFRWTFVNLWRFFTLITTASVFLTLCTLVLGIICMINFGKGLPRYLNAEEPLPDDFRQVVPDGERGGKDYDDEEKIEFPSGRGALPTFSAAFAKDTPPSQMKFGGPRLGPRFNNPSIQPFEPQPEDLSPPQQIKPLPRHQTTYSRDLYTSSVSNTDGATLYDSSRHPSRSGSIGSLGSYETYKSNASSDRSRFDKFSNRWMIE